VTLEMRFHTALSRLENWHTDSVKAQALDGPSVAHTKPGAVELKVQSYPDSDKWRWLWRTAKSESAREGLVEEVEDEYRNLAHSPSKKKDFLSWESKSKLAVAQDERAAWKVAREWGISERTVYRYRKQFG
jgi:hypothetical protein